MKQESKQCLYKIVKRIDDTLRFDEDVMNRKNTVNAVLCA